MRIKLGGVDVRTEGVRPLATLRIWPMGRRMMKDSEYEEAVIEAFKKAGATVTMNGVKQ